MTSGSCVEVGRGEKRGNLESGSWLTMAKGLLHRALDVSKKLDIPVETAD